jgi:hypothetical protein
MNERIGRVVAVGASNLTRGFHTIVATARHLWGPDVEVLVALGHGRSFGGPSTLLVRTIPGILECGLWRALGSREAAPTRALVTDVGNDIMYGYPPAQILGWVDDCVARLRQVTPDVVVTSLPHAATSGLPPARYVLLRSVLFPRCRLTLDEALRIGAEIEQGLESIAAARGAAFVKLRPEWYGLDPIHIRPRAWRAAWQEILCGGEPPVDGPPASWAEAVRLYAMPPERVSYFGVERRTRQRGAALGRGGRVWLY